MPNLVYVTRNSPQVRDIGQNPDRGISDFRISGQFLINENCLDSRTSNDIDMKLGRINKIVVNLTTTPCRQSEAPFSFLDLWPI